MPEMTTLPPELETSLRQALHVPGPDAAFLARLRTQLEQEADMKTDKGVEKLPFFRNHVRNQEISESETKRISPRLAWGLAAALLVLAVSLLATSPGVVEAMKRLFGYIPGGGLVEQGASLRVLAEPVVVERDGITLTVTQALVSPDKTVVAYTVEDIPEAALAPDFSEGQTPPPACAGQDYLHLPDGTILSPTGGQGRSWQLGYEYRWVFGPIPAGVNTADLLIACLLGTSPGAAPENWIIPLAFVPAPPDMTVVPVEEITPSPPPTTETEAGATSTPEPSPVTVERYIELDDGYILIGSFHAIPASEGLVTSPYPWYVRINDASGQDVPYDYAADVDLPPGDESSTPWAYKISGKSFAWPLTLTIDSLEALLPEFSASFEFDTGPAPQPGQEWALDQELLIRGYTVRVLKAIRTPDGYAFTFQADPQVTGLGVGIPGFAVAPAGGGGGGGDGSLSASVAYAGEVPEGRLTVEISTMTVNIPGPWTVQWQPGDAPSQAAPTPSSGPAACVTDEVWAQAKASVPAQIPSGLDGNFIIFGPNADGSQYGVSLLNLAGNSRSFIASGAWPIISPDGTKIVFTGDVGLVVYDLASGQLTDLPGTAPDDYRMVWSPDGSRIAFIRSSTDQMLVINADGTGQQQVADLSVVYRLLVGWADNAHLLITEPGPDGVFIQSLNLADGSTRNLFTISSNKADTVVSPDGGWIAFTSSRGGMLGNGLYVSRLDGSERRMVVALDGRALYFPVWSPDGRWLVVSLPDPDDPVDQTAQALIELDNCRVIPLPDVGGQVYSWGR